MRFRDRAQAGRALAVDLRDLRDRGGLPDPVVVLGLARGGVEVAAEVARELAAPLDALVVRKIGAPFHEEYGIGAVVGDDEPLLDRRAVTALGLTESDLAPAVARERAEIRRRERLYRRGRPAPDPAGRTVVVVDDGLATGSTARAALRALRRRRPGLLVLAVPVGAPDTVERMREEADVVRCLATPTAFTAVGLWYEEFEQLTDDQVIRALESGGPT
ncbi:phosphoribosyltransferase family protein [Streptomyces sp. HSG2]|uniref:phosphoribosyltransferase n=1 Tax=Streptomyces sp. HSG2 TaxID=2797167 RepID=UPI0019068472|nr:phosphoribosyltransferase family protein [Streptomyces sp. HSG2]